MVVLRTFLARKGCPLVYADVGHHAKLSDTEMRFNVQPQESGQDAPLL